MNKIKELSKRVEVLEMKINELSKRVETLEKQIKEDKEEQIKKLKAVRTRKMNKKLAELIVRKSADYYDKVVKTLEDAGFVVVLSAETCTDCYYIVAGREE